MAYENLIVEKADRIAILYVNRPQAMNALNYAVVNELEQAIKDIDNDKSIDVMIVTGSGKAFVAGADIAQMQMMAPVDLCDFASYTQGVFRMIENMKKPSIAAVNGFALGGGCELAMACDFRIASSKALFGQPEVGLGITPGFGGTQRLPRLIGEGMARQLLYTGENIKAAEALRIGLVNQVVEPEELMDTVKAIANKIIKNGNLAVRYCKLAVTQGMQTDIDRSMTIEANLIALTFSYPDQREGMTAFLEKRKPNFIKE